MSTTIKITTDFNSEYLSQQAARDMHEHIDLLNSFDVVYVATMELGTIPEMISLFVFSVFGIFFLYHFAKWALRL